MRHPREKSPEAEAGNMVDWFSKSWTEEDHTWTGLFEKFDRKRPGGHWYYRPRAGLRKVEILREGAMVQVFANRYERDRHARDKCIEHYGTDCFICGFSFIKTYGEKADGIVYVHHLRPLADIGEEHDVDPIKDLRPVCPNCHTVLQWRIPAYSIGEVKEFLSNTKINPPTFTLAPPESSTQL